MRKQLHTLLIHGSSTVNEHGDYTSVGGAYFEPNDNRNISVRIAQEGSTRDSGILTALLLGLRAIPAYAEAKILTARPDLIKALTINLEDGEALDWLNTNDGHLLHPILSELRNRCAPTKLQQ